MSVDVEHHGPVTVVVINRPEVGNTLDRDTQAAIGYAFEAAERDDDVRAVVLTGAGERHFCLGMDLKAFAAGTVKDIPGPGLDIVVKRTYPKPVIGAVNGTAVGGGFELMLACDLLVVSEAARFGLPEVRRGLFASLGGTRLPTRIPLPLALEIGMTGELFDARRLREMGLVNRVVPTAQVRDSALELAGLIARNGPLGVRTTKELMISELPACDWDAISAAWKTLAASEDAREGVAAFVEKREPRWTGR